MSGIACHIRPEAAGNTIVVSLTHLRLSDAFPFAAAVLDYQINRAKKLNKQRRMA
jgi:hypothetical protein